MKRATHFIVVEVSAPKSMSRDQVASLIRTCIGIGMADAAETADNPDWENEMSDQALTLGVKRVA